MRIPLATPLIGEREATYVADALRAGEVSSRGRYVLRFEEAFAAFCGTRYALTTSNGTVALHLALLAMGVGPGDEVLVPALTFVASANAVVHAGARPVFVDVDPQHWTIDIELAEAAVSSRTRAIMPVHLYGHPAAMDEVRALAERRSLAVLEDAAQAHGAAYRGHRVGALGDVAAFSFYANKIITTGEGGMVTTNDGGLTARAHQLKNHGADPERHYWHPVVGYNYRMTNLQAALGLAQLERAEDLLLQRARIATLYRNCLTGAPVTFRSTAPWATPVSWMVCVLIGDGARTSRDGVMEALAAEGIETRPFFHPIPTLPPYRDGRRYPIAERLAHRGLNLPNGAGLSDDEVEEVCDRLRALLT